MIQVLESFVTHGNIQYDDLLFYRAIHLLDTHPDDLIGIVGKIACGVQ